MKMTCVQTTAPQSNLSEEMAVPVLILFIFRPSTSKETGFEFIIALPIFY